MARVRGKFVEKLEGRKGITLRASEWMGGRYYGGLEGCGSG